MPLNNQTCVFIMFTHIVCTMWGVRSQPGSLLLSTWQWLAHGRLSLFSPPALLLCRCWSYFSKMLFWILTYSLKKYRQIYPGCRLQSLSILALCDPSIPQSPWVWLTNTHHISWLLEKTLDPRFFCYHHSYGCLSLGHPHYSCPSQ